MPLTLQSLISSIRNMEKEDAGFVPSREVNEETDDNLVISGDSSNTEFCLVFDDDVMEESSPDENTAAFDSLKIKQSSASSASAIKKDDQTDNVDLDVEAIKKKANVSDRPTFYYNKS